MKPIKITLIRMTLRGSSPQFNDWVMRAITAVILATIVAGCSDPRHKNAPSGDGVRPERTSVTPMDLPDVELSGGGNAGGYSGPHFPDYALDYTKQMGPTSFDAMAANSECLYRGNAEAGLLSLGQKLYRDAYKTPITYSDTNLDYTLPGTWIPYYVYDKFGNLPKAPQIEQLKRARKGEPYFWTLTLRENSLEEDLFKESILEIHLQGPTEKVLATPSMLPLLYSPDNSGRDYFFNTFRPTLLESIEFTDTASGRRYEVNSEDHMQCVLGTLRRIQVENDIGQRLAVSLQAADQPQYDEARRKLCPELTTWFDQRKLITSSAEQKLRVEMAHNYYDVFEQTGTFEHDRVLKCTQGLDDRQNLYNSINQVFFERTLDKLTSLSSPLSERLKMVIDVKNRRLGELVFPLQKNLTVISQYNYPEVPWSASFSRNFGIIHFDMRDLHYNDWVFYFIHELLHKFDRDLHDEASLGFLMEIEDNLPSYVSLDRVLDSRLRFGCMPRSDADVTFRYLIKGLNQGLWSEYRAWYYTFLFYLDGLKSGKLHESKAAQTLLDDITNDPSKLRNDLIRYMMTHLKEPTEPLWASGAGRRLYDEVLRLFNGENYPPPLGDLGIRLDPNRRQHFEDFDQPWNPDRKLEDDFDLIDMAPAEADMEKIFQRLDHRTDAYKISCP